MSKLADPEVFLFFTSQQNLKKKNYLIFLYFVPNMPLCWFMPLLWGRDVNLRGWGFLKCGILLKSGGRRGFAQNMTSAF